MDVNGINQSINSQDSSFVPHGLPHGASISVGCHERQERSECAAESYSACVHQHVAMVMYYKNEQLIDDLSKEVPLLGPFSSSTR